MAYNVAEGVVALWAGMQAGSIALVGFGLDSFIECAAAAALFWRLGVEARALSLMAKAAPEVSEDISGALKRLTDSGRGGMGSMFKALAITEPRLTQLAGLSDEQSAGAATP